MGLLEEWLYLKEVFDKTPVVGPDFLVHAEIPSWPERFIVKSDDLLLEVAKGYGDQAQQDLQITVCSSGYSRFLYDNRHDWPSGELKLPWIHVWLRGHRARSSLATAVYCIVLDATELERGLGRNFLSLHAPYRMPEGLGTIGVTHLGEERIQTYLRALVDAISSSELALSAFNPGGVVAENLYVGDAMCLVIYLALRTGRKPVAVMECLSGFDISQRRAGIEEFVKRAHMRMHEPAAAAEGKRSRLTAPRRRTPGADRIANPVRWSVMISTGLVGWFELSWAWVPVGVTILALDGWPNWRKALVRARYIDTEYAPPMSFRGGIALVIAVSLLANALLCALAFALGRGLALWWS
jgi:hypothetical protein